MRGGMLSGRAASRTGQLSATASQHTFGGWQGGHHRRWQTYVATFRHYYTCHRGWSTHLAVERYRKAQPNQLGIRILRYIRRPRHECENSTAQAQQQHQWLGYRHRYTRADTAVHPYTDNCSMVRDCIFESGFFVTSGDLGTSARHPLRKRSNNINS
jgi:hypothetical protein